MEERQIKFVSRGKKCFGVLHIPDGPLPAPAIVVAHGFTGDKMGANRMFTRFSREACKAGFSVLRFDFIGSGDSEGEFAQETNQSNWLTDFANALQFAAEQAEIDADRIGTVGLSFGGSTVLLTGDAGGRVQAVVTWSATTYLVETWRERILSPDKWAQLERGESIKNFYNKGFALDPQFIHDIPKYDPLAAAAELKIPLLVIQATNDAVVPVAHGQELFEKAAGEKDLVILEEDDHVFTDKLPEATAATVAWFKKYL
ncbi:MAG TPA: alpha/beta fold hydrolase [Firmicutes bacterium]|jgi:dipeptidyl aminopeptidase/acylaminoacyl peptidase|nr:alpha/beta fold hydrolase [Bacillota bacterium]